MLKKWLVLACVLGTLLQAADGVWKIDNIEQEDRPLLVPSVQKYTSAEGIFWLPGVLTVNVPDEESIIVEQLKRELSHACGGEARRVKTQDALCSFILSEEGTPTHTEGYLLDVTPQGITVKARTNAGLYFGAQTLRNLIRNETNGILKGCKIVDWPDFSRRGHFLSIRYMPPKDFPQLKKALDALSALKMNWLLMEFAEAFPYENNPLTKRGNAFTKEQMEDLREFCRVRHLELTPSLQVLSHTLWMTFHPDWATFREADTSSHDWDSQCCLSNPLSYELTKKAVKEQIKLFKPQRFFLLMDEIREEQIESCPICCKKDHRELVAHFVKFAENLVKEEGVTPVLCHDSFVSSYYQPYGDKTRETLDKKDVIVWWSYYDDLPEWNIEPFKGFPLAGHALYARPLNVFNMAHLIKKYGGDEMTVTFWYYSYKGCLYDLRAETPDSLGGMVNACDTMWHLTETPYARIPYDGVYEMMRLMYPEKIRHQIRDQKAQPYPLDRYINSDLSELPQFPSLSKQQVTTLAEKLSQMPEHFRLVTDSQGHYYGLRLSGYRDIPGARLGARFDLGNKCAERLSFLLTTSRPDNAIDYISFVESGKCRYKAEKAALLKVDYADGTTINLPLRYRYELNEWNRPFGGAFSRSVVRGVDEKERYFTFGVYEFDNPKPRTPIKYITFDTAGLNGISPVLLALSLYGCEAYPLPGKFSAQMIRIPLKEPVKPKAEIHTVEDFEADAETLKKITVRADHKPGSVTDTRSPMQVEVWNGAVEKPKVEIVTDPTVPGKDKKVLKITVVPKKDNEGKPNSGYLRVCVIMPYTITSQMKYLAVTSRVVCKSGFSRLQEYLFGEDGVTHRYYRDLVKNTWSQCYSPVDSDTRNKCNPYLEDASKAVSRCLSYFFDGINAPCAIYIDNIGDSVNDINRVSDWGPNMEAE